MLVQPETNLSQLYLSQSPNLLKAGKKGQKNDLPVTIELLDPKRIEWGVN